MLTANYAHSPMNHQWLQVAKVIMKHFLFWPDFPADSVMDAFSFKPSLPVSLSWGPVVSAPAFFLLSHMLFCLRWGAWQALCQNMQWTEHTPIFRGRTPFLIPWKPYSYASGFAVVSSPSPPLALGGGDSGREEPGRRLLPPWPAGFSFLREPVVQGRKDLLTWRETGREQSWSWWRAGVMFPLGPENCSLFQVAHLLPFHRKQGSQLKACRLRQERRR